MLTLSLRSVNVKSMMMRYVSTVDEIDRLGA